MRTILSIFCLILTFNLGTAQDKLPTDYLKKEFHKERREAFRKLMPKNSVAVVFANAVRNRSNDVDYVYHQDPNFFYLTGYNEPHSVLLIFSEDQETENGTVNEMIFARERNAAREQWDGRRLGVDGVKNKLGFDNVASGSSFKNLPVDLTKFDKILMPTLQNDVRDARGSADLFDLITQFKEQSGYSSANQMSSMSKRIYSTIDATPIENSSNLVPRLKAAMEQMAELKDDQLLVDFTNAKDDAARKELQQKMKLQLASDKFDTDTFNSIAGQLREVKTPEEMVLLKKAIEISAVGQIEIMKAMHPNMSETEIQGVHEFIYKKYGAEYEGYPSIVGGGNNGCILHYIENNKTEVGQDLVLMDLGAEYHGYTADVTRTIPANGKFTEEQKAIYDLVYDAQEAGIKVSVVGGSFSAPGKVARDVINEGLAKLGIIASADAKHRYFPHGTSHYLGLDVHDPGTYGAFKANTVITVEPGIYIPDGSPCDKKWWGIAVRIEDDILITDNGPVNLSAMAPRKSEEIEKLMKQKSVLSKLELPSLD
ncbi:aminopeptidase P N-terminal domain-containing protein [Spongiivirga citrea]|uniref:Xaa-Pro aminopeptidase n=1 Tax=Spongiivirga citrea TaxID=1481457 RepID=A0A6M0CJ24_9FLAO|nr:aminopeptidase P N-terminal domain-containing protein [Spongiivirga citrea]NER17915.1 M24 family metallopeptidase [Spongiivirga citrea]